MPADWKDHEQRGMNALYRKEAARSEVLRLAVEVEKSETLKNRAAFFEAVRSYTRATADLEAHAKALGVQRDTQAPANVEDSRHGQDKKR